MKAKSGNSAFLNKHFLCAVLTGLCAVYQHFAFSYYCDGDNYTISVVLNSLYGNDNISQYINPVLSVAVKALAKVFPSADCYSLICWIFMMAAVYASFLFVLEKLPGVPKKALGVLIVFLLIFVFCGGVFCNFTLQAAITGAVGWLYVLQEIRSEQIRKGRVIFAGLLLCFGLMVRNTTALLLLPFAALVPAAELIEPLSEKKRPYIKKHLKVFVPILIIFAALLLVQYAVLYSPEYRASAEYDNVRSRFIDYPILPYDQSRLGEVSKNDYYSVTNWILADTDIVTPEYYEKLSESSGISWRMELEYELQSGAGLLAGNIFLLFTDVFIKLMNCFMPFLLLETVTNRKLSTVKKLAVVLAYAGAGIIMLYFHYSGRLPERVSLSILLGIILTRCALTGDGSERTGGEKDSPLHIAILALLAVLSLTNCIKAVSETEYQSKASFLSAKAADSEEKYDDDILYIWAASDSLTDLMKDGRLPTEEYLRHNIPIGGWEYGQNFFKELLSDIHAENPMKALLYRENTYYVQKEEESLLPDFVLNWLREHYDENAQSEITGGIGSFTVWKFSAEEDNANPQ